MESQQTEENIEITTKFGIDTILKIVFRNKLFKSHAFRYSILFALFFFSLIILFKQNPIYYIIEIKTQCISFIPGILGFTLSAYALLVGFSQTEMLLKITEPLEEENKNSKVAKKEHYSLYQIMSSTFAINVIVQALALALAYIVHFVSILCIRTNITSFFQNGVIDVTNYLTLFLMLYAIWISIFLVVQSVVNIFNFSQLHQFYVNKEKLNKK